MPIPFRLRLIPFIATALAVAVGLSAGLWQTRRAEQKQRIETTLAQRAAAAPLTLGERAVPLEQIEYARVRVRGSFVADWPLFLENRPQQGHAGFYVLMPLRLEGSRQAIMVMRGWAPRNAADRGQLPVFSTPEGVVELEGLVRKDAGHVLQLGSAPALLPHAILQNLTLAEFSAASKLPLLPYLLEQYSDNRDGLLRDWPRASSGITMHRGYAFQWYGLAGAALLFFLVTGFRRGSSSESKCEAGSETN